MIRPAAAALCLALLTACGPRSWIDWRYSTAVLHTTVEGPTIENSWGTRMPTSFEIAGLRGYTRSPTEARLLRAFDGKTVEYKIRRKGSSFYVRLRDGEAFMDIYIDSNVERDPLPAVEQDEMTRKEGRP